MEEAEEAEEAVVEVVSISEHYRTSNIITSTHHSLVSELRATLSTKVEVDPRSRAERPQLLALIAHLSKGN